MPRYNSFIDKRFNLHDKVIAHSLGPSMPGEFKATVCGIHAMEPFEQYVIGWDEPEKINKFYLGNKLWTHCVMSKGCLKLAE